MKNQIDIFLVDDDQAFVHFIKKTLLKEKGDKIKIHSFSSGEDCLNELEKNPDLIVLDYHLNSCKKTAMNGDEILKQIKSQSPSSKLLMLSSQKKTNIVIETLQNGADGYFVKNKSSAEKICKWTDQHFTKVNILAIRNEVRFYTNLLLLFISIGFILSILISIMYGRNHLQ